MPRHCVLGSPSSVLDRQSPRSIARPGSSLRACLRVCFRVCFGAGLALAAAPLAAATQQPAPVGGFEIGSQEGGKIILPKLQSLTISGEYRLRFEDAYNYDFNDRLSDDRDFFTQRTRLNFDAKVNDDISAFIQIQDVRNWGEEMSTTDDSADGLDLHRAYLRVDNTCVGGTATIGRQVLAFGDERLVGGLEWLSQGRAFDGYRHTWKEEDAQTIDVFVTNIKEMMPSAVYDDAWFAGVYATLDNLEDTEVDLYLLFLNDEEIAGGGNENRTTIGVRYEQKIDRVEVGAELATQMGEIGGADITFGDAYAAHVHATWNMQGDLQPWVRLEANYATGNDPGTADNERFKNLFPTAHGHWGMMDFALWENTLHGMAQFGLMPSEQSKFVASWHVFEAVEETDAFIGPVGKIAPTGNPAGTSKSMGNEIDLFYNLEFDTQPARTWLQAGYGVFLPGSGAKAAAGADDPAHFVYVMTGLQF